MGVRSGLYPAEPKCGDKRHLEGYIQAHLQSDAFFFLRLIAPE